jgi:hypothetical protein
MDSRLMTDDDLAIVTGKRRFGKQAEWFKDAFGVELVKSATGRPVITWALFEALQAKAAGLRGDGPVSAVGKLHFD